MPKTPEQKAARAAYMRDYYANNEAYREGAKARAVARQAREKAENPEAFRATQAAATKKWRKANPERTAATRRRGWDAAKERAQEFVNAIKVATPCADCGRYFPAVCMDFDHVSGEKDACIGTLVGRAAALKKIAAEIAKCEVVCACCHRLRTMERWQAQGFDPTKEEF